MLGSLVYCMLDISFNILFWTTKKSFGGISMIYYYYYNDNNNDNNYIIEKKKDINMLEIQKQIFNHSKMLKELKSKLDVKIVKI